jgi:cysteine protease ATG4
MESKLANVDLGPYRRIVQLFWDPEPVNDAIQDQPIWCLGRSYQLASHSSTKTVERDTTPTAESVESLKEDRAKPVPATNSALETPPDSTSSSFSSSLAYDESTDVGNWPQGFLDDFESKFWMTYRFEFEPIARSSDPKARSSLSLSMRIKSQLGGDQTGFSSDSGWGCMIRSGQSLLANSIAILRLGRGIYTPSAPLSPAGKELYVNIGIDWRRGSLKKEERELIRSFSDDPKAPYSIHNFVKHGAEACGKYPGEWFGPSATARCIR